MGELRPGWLRLGRVRAALLRGGRWNPGPYDKFRVFVSWLPDFSARVTSGDRLLIATHWQIPPKKWRRACGAANPYLYLKIFGVDPDVPKRDQARKTFSQTVQVSVQP